MEKWQKDIECKNVPFQTYECCYHIYLPWLSKYTWESNDQKQYMLVSIDKCLLPEILSLWEMGIKTTGCCCGHGKQKPFIGVTKDNIQRMKDLGYKIQFNYCRPGAEDSFVPKTELNYGKSKCTEV